MIVSSNTWGIFNETPVDCRDRLMPLFEPYLCSSGTVVLQQGKPANFLYQVLDGSAKVSYKPYDGNPITVAHVERGGWFGWSAAIGGKYYTCSTIATESLAAVRVRGSDLRRFCSENPEVGKDLLELLAHSVSGRWRNTHEQVISILAQGMREASTSKEKLSSPV